MKKYLFFFLFFCGAWASSKVMTMNAYYEVEVGWTESQLKDSLGRPFAVKSLSSGERELEYIERVFVDDRMVELRHYFFTIKGDIVTSKRMVEDKFKGKRLLERNAYDLQTTLNNEDEKGKSKD